MYDLTNRNSFDNLYRWFNLLSQNVSNKPKILVANKLDLATEGRIITEEEGKNVADSNDMPFYEASGSNGENVDKIFYKMAEMIYANLIDEKDSRQLNQKLQNKQEKKKCCK